MAKTLTAFLAQNAKKIDNARLELGVVEVREHRAADGDLSQVGVGVEVLGIHHPQNAPGV